MKEDKVVSFDGREETRDLLTDTLRTGAQRLLASALELEIEEFLESYSADRLASGQQRIVRNGHLPEREVQTGIGGIAVKVPRARDREGEVKFKSTLLPPYLKRTKSIEELLPWLYLKGISTNDFGSALQSLLGIEAPGLTASSISRLKSRWEEECSAWRTQDLSKKNYIYIWADGIYCGIRGEDEKMCLLVIMGLNDTGKKELIALDDGYRESADTWLSVLRSLKDRGLVIAPKLAIGDGSLGFWKALPQVFPETKSQRCWQHKTLNILNNFPAALRGKVLNSLHQIWMAETKVQAQKAWDIFVRDYKDKYPNAVECLNKDSGTLLTFYDFPAEHWKSIRTTNPIESTFATVRHRAKNAKGCVSRASMLAFAFKLIQTASKRWKRVAGFERVAQVITGVKFVDGIATEKLTDQQQDIAA